MKHDRFTRGLRHSILASVAVLLVTSSACAPHAPVARQVARDPRQWTPVDCSSCTQAGVQVSVRNTLDAKGKSGRHMAAHIRNLNAHTVVLVLQIVPEQARPMDVVRQSERFTVVLHPAGKEKDAHVVLFPAREIEEVSVLEVERL